MSSCLSRSPGPSQGAPLQLQGVTKKPKKGNSLASWLGGLSLVKSSDVKSWTAKERLSGSGSGFDSGESISYGKISGGSIFEKLLRVKG